MIGIRRYSHLSRKIVGRSHRADTKRYVISVEPIHDFIDRSVTAHGGDDVGPASGGVGGEGSGVAGIKRDHRFDVVTLVPHPTHQVTYVAAIGTRAVHDQRDVLGFHGS